MHTEARQGGSPLGPDTPAHCEVPFAPPSVGSSPSSLWGHNSVHSDASTGSAQAVEEPQSVFGSDSKGAAAEGVQVDAGAVPPGLQEAVCACGMHTLARLAGDSPADSTMTAPAVPSTAKAPERKTPPLERGEMADAFRQLTKQVQLHHPCTLVRCLLKCSALSTWGQGLGPSTFLVSHWWVLGKTCVMLRVGVILGCRCTASVLVPQWTPPRW